MKEPGTTHHSFTNLCNLPSWVIASRSFNEDPTPISVQGVRTTHHHFFDQLDQLDTWEDRARMYQDYMEVAFHLHQWRREKDPTGHLSLKHSYLRFLRGWLFDSNSTEGAVMKGWVESRMGIPPTFHQKRIVGIHSEAYLAYMRERLNGSARTNAIFSQLDLLYEFVQYELARRDPQRSHVKLFRGIYDFSEHDIIEELEKPQYVIRLNNLNSFTRDFERAWEFGTQVLEVSVPIHKIFFDGSFLHSGILRGEEEVLVIGGEYEVTVRYY
jgi:NAD+--dinitrogen-reductase ADP-D-ribosyltransferase